MLSNTASFPTRLPLLILLGILGCAASAALAQVDDLDVQRVEQSNASATVTDGAGDSTALTADDATSADADAAALEDELLQAIEDIEIASGPFDLSLTEPLEQLADTLMAQGKYSDALQHYARLLHINRINQGLYNEDQFRLIEKVIEGNLALKDWTALNDSQEYYYFLSQRVYADEPEKNLNILNRYINWKLVFAGLDTKDDKSGHFLDLEEYTDLAVEIAEKDPQLSVFDLAGLSYRQALINYYISVPQDSANETGVRLIAAGPVPPSELAALDANLGTQRYIEDLQQNHRVFENKQIYRVVRRRLRETIRGQDEIVEKFKEKAEFEAEAMATLYSADWELLAGNKAKALEKYQAVYEKLLSLGIEKSRLDQIFSSPMPIPRPKPFFTFADFEAEMLNREKLPELEIYEVESSSEFDNLGIYYAWSDELPGLSFPKSLDDLNIDLDTENFIDIEFTIAVEDRKLASETGVSGVRFTPDGKGNVRDLILLELESSKEKTKREGLDDIDLLMFRPKLVNGEAVETRARLRYIFAPDE